MARLSPLLYLQLQGKKLRICSINKHIAKLWIQSHLVFNDNFLLLILCLRYSHGLKANPGLMISPLESRDPKRTFRRFFPMNGCESHPRRRRPSARTKPNFLHRCSQSFPQICSGEEVRQGKCEELGEESKDCGADCHDSWSVPTNTHFRGNSPCLTSLGQVVDEDVQEDERDNCFG